MEVMKIKIIFLEEALGLSSAVPEIHEEYVASKAPDAPSMAEEVAAIGAEAVVEKAMTIFPKLPDGTPFFWDYQIKGFFKDACGALRKADGSLSSKVKAYKKEIDGLIFPSPRKIPISLSGAMGTCQRPLRAQTAQGDRVALANSETVPDGSSIEFEIKTLSKAHLPLIREWLDYGQFRGLSQWRNSGKGRFEWHEL